MLAEQEQNCIWSHGLSGSYGVSHPGLKTRTCLARDAETNKERAHKGGQDELVTG
ncbi:hypothetical protein PSCICM_01710 [Pseudomonas cichorii]|uniref:Uncharacterized protein n=1 Tax=Pseudomonas cichorii TaxID=36746 RepID=A0ABQ1DKN4_PSECI|nr:hypothetical protein PSCICM_01710 [Pseudomonas cichorii]GFM91558.1 hypothetical protein PSCICP_15300 [Pseudomonas cichorii]